MKTLLRGSVMLLVVACSLCSPDRVLAGNRKPSEAEVLGYLGIPAFFSAELSETKTEPLLSLNGTGTPSGSWQVSGKLVIVPKEPVYELGLSNVDDEKGRVATGDLLNAQTCLSGRSDNPLQSQLRILNILRQVGAPADRFSSWVRFAAVPRGDSEWKFTVLDGVDKLPAWFDCKPRSAFPADSLIWGTPEATAALDRLHRVLKAYYPSPSEPAQCP